MGKRRVKLETQNEITEAIRFVDPDLEHEWAWDDEEDYLMLDGNWMLSCKNVPESWLVFEVDNWGTETLIFSSMRLYDAVAELLKARYAHVVQSKLDDFGKARDFARSGMGR